MVEKQVGRNRMNCCIVFVLRHVRHLLFSVSTLLEFYQKVNENFDSLCKLVTNDSSFSESRSAQSLRAVKLFVSRNSSAMRLLLVI